MQKIFLVFLGSVFLYAEDYSALKGYPIQVNYKNLNMQRTLYIDNVVKNTKGEYKLYLAATKIIEETRAPDSFLISEHQIDLLLKLHLENMNKKYLIEHSSDHVKPRFPESLFIAIKSQDDTRVRELGLYFKTSDKMLLYPVGQAGYQDLNSKSQFRLDSTFTLKPFSNFETIQTSDSPENKAETKKKLVEQMYYLNAGEALIPVYVIGEVGDKKVLVVPKAQLTKYLEGNADVYEAPKSNIVSGLDKSKYNKDMLQFDEKRHRLLESLESISFMKKVAGFLPPMNKKCPPSILEQVAK